MRRYAAKAGVAVGVVRRCKNWPQVLYSWIANRAPGLRGLRPQRLVIRLRTGVVLAAPNTLTSGYPAFEVLIADVYRLETTLATCCGPAGPRVVVDVGAHVGAFAIAAADKWPNTVVHAFEPLPASLAYLRQNIAVNHLASRVIVHEVAVSSSTGEVELYADEPTSCEATAFPDVLRPHAHVQMTYRCRQVAFDDLIRDLGDVDLVKLDCEGAEYDIVLGSSAASWSGVKVVVLEFHPRDGLGWPALQRRFEELGFTLQWLEVHEGGRLGTACVARPAVEPAA